MNKRKKKCSGWLVLVNVAVSMGMAYQSIAYAMD